MTRLAAILVGLLLAIGAVPIEASAQGLADLINNEPATPPPPAPPAPAPPREDGAAPQNFPALVGCERSLAGLAFGSSGDVIARLRQRIGAWNGAVFGTVPAFASLAQARSALECFLRRADLMATFIIPSAETLRKVDAFEAQFGGRALSYLAGAIPAGADPAIWWAEADGALRALAELEREVGTAVARASAARNTVLQDAIAALTDLAIMVGTVADLPAPAPGENFQWGRGLAWRALLVGKELDRLQLSDLEQYPGPAYAHLTGTMAGAAIASDVVELLSRATALRAARGALVPGDPRDWSQEGNRTRYAEEIFILHAIEQNLGAWIESALQERAERKRAALRTMHDAAMADGMTEAQSRALRNTEWEAFQAFQGQQRQESLARWTIFLAEQRASIIAAAIALPR